MIMGVKSPLSPEKFLKDDLGEPNRPPYTLASQLGGPGLWEPTIRSSKSPPIWPLPEMQVCLYCIGPQINPPGALQKDNQFCLPIWFLLQAFKKTLSRTHEALTQTHTSRKCARIIWRLAACQAQSSELKCSTHLSLEAGSMRYAWASHLWAKQTDLVWVMWALSSRANNWHQQADSWSIWFS